MATHLPGVLYTKMPNGNAAPLVFDSPHSGHAYPSDFDHLVPGKIVRQSEDSFVDELFSHSAQYGAFFQAALFPRSYIDPNRALSDIDPILLDEPWPDHLEPGEKTRSGHGLIWRICPPNLRMYDRKLSVAEVKNRIENYWRPYHNQLCNALTLLYERFGQVWHLNCHSMPTMMHLKGRHPDFVLGNIDGATCSTEFLHFVANELEAMGYRVRINDPYKGVELVRAYSDPSRGRHSLQIEIRRSLYMNEETLERNGGFAALQQNLERLTARIRDYANAQVQSTFAKSAD